jgi:transposase
MPHELLLSEDEIVVVNNMPAHKIDGMRKVIEAAKASLVYLPSYSPDLIPSRWWRPLRVNDGLAIQPQRGPLSAVAPISDKPGRSLFFLEVPSSTIRTARNRERF